jgi:hypothetical protein
MEMQLSLAAQEVTFAYHTAVSRFLPNVPVFRGRNGNVPFFFKLWEPYSTYVLRGTGLNLGRITDYPGTRL